MKLSSISILALFFLMGRINAQVPYTRADSIALFALITKGNNFQSAGNSDSALYFYKQAETQAAEKKFRRGQAHAYDWMAELMLANGKIAEVEKYNNLLQPLVAQVKDTSLLINLQNRTGVFYMEKGKNKEAEQAFTNALALGLGKKESKKTAEVNSNLGSLYLALGEKDKAVDKFFTALRLYEKNNSEIGMGETYSNISSVYYLMGKVDDAINYQKTSIALREKLNDRSGLVITNTNIGQLYILKESYPLALEHLQNAVQYAEQLKNPKLMAVAYSGMTAYGSRTRNYPDALKWQNKAIQLFEEADNKQLLSRLYVSAGNLANATQDSVSAVNYYQKALAISRELGNKENIGNAYEKLSSFYVSRKDYEKAHDNYKNFILYRDSITARSALAKVEEIRAQYETEKKDNEISRLNTTQRIKQLEIEKQKAIIAGNAATALQKQNEIDLLSQAQELQNARIKEQEEELVKQELIATASKQQLQLAETEKQLQEKEIKNQKTLRNLLIGGLVLLLLLGYTYFNRYQLKKKLEQQKSLLSMRNNISQDLHDDIGASLSNINILNELARRNISQPDKSTAYLSKASEDIQRISESLSDIVWNINPRYDDMQNLFIRMKRYAADMFDGKNINGHFDFPADQNGLQLSMTQRRDLYLVFKEAINNLVKYSGAKEASVLLKTGKDKIILQIRDNGKGFDRQIIKPGNGLYNMEQRAKASGGSLHIESAPGSGTLVEMEMRVA